MKKVRLDVQPFSAAATMINTLAKISKGKNSFLIKLDFMGCFYLISRHGPLLF